MRSSLIHLHLKTEELSFIEFYQPEREAIATKSKIGSMAQN